MSKKNILDNLGKTKNKERNDLALKLFNKAYPRLQLLEVQRVEDELHPEWRETKTRKGHTVEVSNIGQVRDPVTKQLYKVYYPSNDNTAKYLTIWLDRDDDPHKQYPVTIHRLVAQAFVDNPDPEHKTEVNHIDCNKQNNWWRNLEWVTRGQNIAWRYIKNKADGALGENSHFNVYTEKQIIDTCELMCKHPDRSDAWITRQTGVGNGTIAFLREKKIWKHITEKYDFPPKNVAWHTNDKSARELELLQQGLSIADVTTKITEEFNLDIDRKRLYSQIGAMKREWQKKGLLPKPDKEDVNSVNL